MKEIIEEPKEDLPALELATAASYTELLAIVHQWMVDGRVVESQRILLEFLEAVARFVQLSSSDDLQNEANRIYETYFNDNSPIPETVISIAHAVASHRSDVCSFEFRFLDESSFSHQPQHHDAAPQAA